MNKLTVYLGMLALLLLSVPGMAQVVDFAGTQANAPFAGSLWSDMQNVYLTVTTSGDQALALDEDYLAIAVDANNDNLWTEGQDGILVYDYYNNDGASWWVVASLEYAGGVWDCPWSDPKVKPGDAAWPVGMSITPSIVSGDEFSYSAAIPLSAIGVSPGSTIGLLVQMRDKNVAKYGGNGRVLNWWPNSTCFNALYDPAQFYEYQTVPEPGSLLALSSGIIGLAGLALRRRRNA